MLSTLLVLRDSLKHQMLTQQHFPGGGGKRSMRTSEVMTAKLHGCWQLSCSDARKYSKASITTML